MSNDLVNAGANGQEPILLKDEVLPAHYRLRSEGAEEDLALRDYLDVLIRRRWTLAAFFVIVVATTVFLTLVKRPIYKASVLLEIRQENPKVVAFKEVIEAQAHGYQEFYQTQYDVLKSRTLAERALAVLDGLGVSTGTKGEGPGLLATVRAAIASIVPRRRGVSVDEETKKAQQRVERFLKRVEISPRRNSYLVDVSFSHPDPHVAAKTVNVLAEEYINMSLDQRIHASEKGRRFIEKQLGITKAALERSEEELQAFSESNEIVTMDEKQNIAYQKLADLNESLTRAQSARIAKESLYRQTQSGDLGGISLIVDNPLVKSLKEELARVELQRSKLAETFTPEYPEMKRVQGQIAALRQRIGAEEKRIVAAIRADYEAAKRREELLSAALEEQKKVVSDFNERAIDYKILRREVDTNRGIYNALLQRLKEVEVTEGIKASNIQVIDKADVPLYPDEPRPMRNLLLAIVVGLMGGVGLAFVQENLDSSLKSPEDVEKYLLLPTLGIMPTIRQRKSNGAKPEVSAELVAHEEPMSHAAESLRTLRAALFLATASGPPSRLIVTSARPQEGKSCVVANLAVSLSQMGKRVVLVDADLRRPRLHRIFDVEISPGVSNYLTGARPLPELLRKTAVPSVDLVASGPIPPNPAELLDSERMRLLLEELERRYDFVLLDVPPTLGFADVPLLSRFAGSVLLVVRSGETPRKIARRAGDYLLRLQAKILGVVLNDVAADRPGYYYYDYYGYGSYYRYNPNREPTLELPKAS